MRAERELKKRLEKKREEIQGLERQLLEAKAYYSAMEESFKLISKDSDYQGDNSGLRAGTDLAKVRDVLLHAGKPMHVTEILTAIGKETTKQNKVSLSGSLGMYVRDERIFTRPGPNTFGLVEFNAGDDLPEGFGETPEDAQ